MAWSVPKRHRPRQRVGEIPEGRHGQTKDRPAGGEGGQRGRGHQQLRTGPNKDTTGTREISKLNRYIFHQTLRLV